MSTTLRIAALSLTLLSLATAGCSGEIKVGAIISESGGVAPYGEKVKKGLDLALEEVNDDGGFRGKPILVSYKDDATIAARGKEVAQELIDEGVKAIIGAVSSEVTLAIAPICDQERVVLLSPSASAPRISDAGDWVYRNYPSDILEGTAMAKFAKEELGLERIVIFAQNSAFGQGLKEVFTNQYAGRFTEVVKVFDFKDGADDSFPAMVEQVKELAPDGIYLISYLADLVTLLTLLDEANVNAVRMGSASVTGDVARLAGQAAEYLVYPQPVFDLESNNPVVSAFVSAYRGKYGGEDPDIYAAHGYDAMKLLVAAMETGGSAHPQDIRLGLGGISNYEGAAGRTSFDEHGDVVRYPRIFVIHEGAPLEYDKLKEQGGTVLPR